MADRLPARAGAPARHHGIAPEGHPGSRRRHGEQHGEPDAGHGAVGRRTVRRAVLDADGGVASGRAGPSRGPRASCHTRCKRRSGCRTADRARAAGRSPRRSRCRDDARDDADGSDSRPGTAMRAISAVRHARCQPARRRHPPTPDRRSRPDQGDILPRSGPTCRSPTNDADRGTHPVARSSAPPAHDRRTRPDQASSRLEPDRPADHRTRPLGPAACDPPWPWLRSLMIDDRVRTRAAIRLDPDQHADHRPATRNAPDPGERSPRPPRLRTGLTVARPPGPETRPGRVRGRQRRRRTAGRGRPRRRPTRRRARCPP